MCCRGSIRHRHVTRHRSFLAATAALLFGASGLAAGAGLSTGHAADLQVQNATIEPIPGEAALRVSGPVGWSFEADVRDGLRQYPQTRVLLIDGPGGLRGQALRVAELANERGLVVRVDGRCASACALLWAAAERREMTFDSGIGLHKSALDPTLPLPDSMRAKIMARNDRQTDDVLRHAHFPDRIISVGATTPASSMSWFSPYELKTGGVPFVLLDRQGRAASIDPETGRITAQADGAANVARQN